MWNINYKKFIRENIKSVIFIYTKLWNFVVENVRKGKKKKKKTNILYLKPVITFGRGREVVVTITYL